MNNTNGDIMTDAEINKEISALGLSHSIPDTNKLQMEELIKVNNNQLALENAEIKKQQENQLNFVQKQLEERMQKESEKPIQEQVQLRIEHMNKEQSLQRTDMPLIGNPNQTVQQLIETDPPSKQQDLVVVSLQQNQDTPQGSLQQPPVQARKPECRPIPKVEPVEQINIKTWNAWTDKPFQREWTPRGQRGGNPIVRKFYQQKYSDKNRIIDAVVDLQFGMAQKIAEDRKKTEHENRQHHRQHHHWQPNNHYNRQQHPREHHGHRQRQQNNDNENGYLVIKKGF